MKRNGIFAFVLLLAASLVPWQPAAADTSVLELPSPRTEGGKPLMEALRDRHSSREFSSASLPPQLLSDLLWAASGVNRPESGKRTAPSARNKQEIGIYVATAQGLYLYDASRHRLAKILDQDIRAKTGVQAYVADAPVNLVYVADFAAMGEATETDKVLFSAADAGFIGQNVYLFCASAGLATVVRGLIDRPALARLMGLSADQRIILAQTVGHPRGTPEAQHTPKP